MEKVVTSFDDLASVPTESRFFIYFICFHPTIFGNDTTYGTSICCIPLNAAVCAMVARAKFYASAQSLESSSSRHGTKFTATVVQQYLQRHGDALYLFNSSALVAGTSSSRGCQRTMAPLASGFALVATSRGRQKPRTRPLAILSSIQYTAKRTPVTTCSQSLFYGL